MDFGIMFMFCVWNSMHEVWGVFRGVPRCWLCTLIASTMLGGFEMNTAWIPRSSFYVGYR